MACGFSSRSPEVATITGSSTTFLACQRSSPAATASITAGCESMPIFTAPHVEIGEHRIDLRRDKVRRHIVDCGDTLGVLRGQRRDDARTIDTERGESL